ncbi:hypothetical protein [Sporolactobacillus terrae]|uniref:VOC domain-containing protein n=1 Tax=Sporolactobacillus terrae TaxID=269673 RepID=A0ABX5Q5F9_9BACL|nr:hypothetical protein [Sporolactobacillus terrae]QAA21864.1 hypothetical protein C0674_04120 [Sporolactobacillus terrae]QAA24837.1 hypothetical protein C0679_04095 [Sporolactobacillus terrae]
MLFHYHFWTPFVEETEEFYKANGFHVSQRIWRYQNEFQSFNPPQTWEDFRNKPILFRIIEMKKGAINITFGFGKKVRFDHIGFLVSDDERRKIIESAKQMHRNIQVNERRTFIGTPYGFRIELQTNHDVVESEDSPISIHELDISTTSKDFQQFFIKLFKKDMSEIVPIFGDKTTITRAVINHISLKIATDPNGVTLQNKTIA